MKHLLISLVSLFVAITVLTGCSDAAKQAPSSTLPSGVVRLSILFPARENVRTIPDATQSILITATGTGILADKPFRKGYNRPLPSQPQQVDAELILPLGTKTIRADARDVSASDAEQFNSGNTLATAQQTVNLTDANLYEPATITLDMQVPTPVLTYSPTKIKWSLTNSAGTVNQNGTILPINQTDTQQLYYLDSMGQSTLGSISTTITAALTATPAATPTDQPFAVKLELTRAVTSDIPGLVGISRIYLGIPNTTPAQVSSYVSTENPAKVSLLLDFVPVNSGIFHINETANPGFSGYGTGVTVINQGQPGGYSGNWNIGYWGSSIPGLTLNGNICLNASVDYYMSPAIVNSQYSKVAYNLEINAGYYPNQ